MTNRIYRNRNNFKILFLEVKYFKISKYFEVFIEEVKIFEKLLAEVNDFQNLLAEVKEQINI